MNLDSKKMILGLQHLFAMFGATIVVPMATGLNPPVALITAGLGTLLFHFVTGKKVPVFLGSSFAFIAAVALVVKEKGIPAAQGGIIAAGLIYVLLSVLVKFIGSERVQKLFPPVVTGPVIVVIGLTLSPFAISDASTNWIVALVVIAIIIIVSVFTKGFFRLVPVFFGLIGGYLFCLIADAAGLFPEKLINFTAISSSPWISPIWDFSGGFFSIPVFDMSAILLIAPIAFVTFMEHIGDITTNGSVVGKNFFKDPGLHRTLLGDGLATILAGLFGGPANTTYSENTGVLAVTKNYDPQILRIAAVYAIILGCFGKFGAVLQTLPVSLKGGMCIILYGMIASIGIRTMADAKLDFTHSRNLIIVALILVLGLGLTSVTIGSVSLSGIFFAVVVGAVANFVLPQEN